MTQFARLDRLPPYVFDTVNKIKMEARRAGENIIDFAYADLVFDDYKAPSFLQAGGAKEVGVEFFSLSKSQLRYNLAKLL